MRERERERERERRERERVRFIITMKYTTAFKIRQMTLKLILTLTFAP